MTAQPITIPTPEIIDDLLVDNWELRWQVLDIFYQTRIKSSPYNRAVIKLIDQTINMLHGENDVNLQLIILAVYLLGGNEGVLKIFNKLEISNPPASEKADALHSLRDKVLKGERGHSFYDYFLFLYRENLFPESTITLSLKLFYPDELKELFLQIPDPKLQAESFHKLRQRFPQAELNEILIADDLQLIKKNPQLIACLKAPLEPIVFKKVEALALGNFDRQEYLEATLEACAELKIHAAIPYISKLLHNKSLLNQATTALGKLGSEIGLDDIMGNARSFFSSKKTEAATLLGNYQNQKAIHCLQKLGNSHNNKLREAALKSLAQTGQSQALTTLINRIMKAPAKEKKSLLAAVGQRQWSEVPSQLANKIVPMIDDSSLAPESFQALRAMGHGDLLLPWFKTLAAPLKAEHHKTACLFLAADAAIPAVKDALIPHLQHSDWGFSFRLICRLRDSFTIKDFPVLFKLLELRESYKPLTIKERLELGKGDDEFVPAMCHYLNQHPQIVRKLLFRINNHLLTRKPPLKYKELEKVLEGHPDGLTHLVTEAPFGQRNVTPETLYVLLLFCCYLNEITVDGSSCFAIIVNMTRKYSGFFSEIIWSIILAILQAERTSTDTAILPYLDQLLETLRGRQDVEDLRTRVLTIKKRIFALSRDLVVFIESNRSRDLQVFKVKKVNG